MQSVKQIVDSKFLYRSTLDIPSMDEYLLRKNLDRVTIYNLHKFISEKHGDYTFNFTDIFIIKFERIIKDFIAYYDSKNLFETHSKSFEIDDKDIESPIKFKDSVIHKIFTMWLKRGY
jgi:hypothetical protein